MSPQNGDNAEDSLYCNDEWLAPFIFVLFSEDIPKNQSQLAYVFLLLLVYYLQSAPLPVQSASVFLRFLFYFCFRFLFYKERNLVFAHLITLKNDDVRKACLGAISERISTTHTNRLSHPNLKKKSESLNREIHRGRVSSWMVVLF